MPPLKKTNFKGNSRRREWTLNVRVICPTKPYTSRMEVFQIDLKGAPTININGFFKTFVSIRKQHFFSVLLQNTCWSNVNKTKHCFISKFYSLAHEFQNIDRKHMKRIVSTFVTNLTTLIVQKLEFMHEPDCNAATALSGYPITQKHHAVHEGRTRIDGRVRHTDTNEWPFSRVFLTIL